MSRQSGISLNELLIVITVAGLSLLATVTYTFPRVAREGLHNAVYDIHTYMQMARVEAISRDRTCRFVVDTENHRIEVMDTAGTVELGDDILLYATDLSSNVSFQRPDNGAAITLNKASTETFQALFGNDGHVTLGAGEVVMLGGSSYERVRVGADGEIRIHSWDGTGWVTSS
jgi:Tfp pilus assembly protein FimT